MTQNIWRKLFEQFWINLTWKYVSWYMTGCSLVHDQLYRGTKINKFSKIRVRVKKKFHHILWVKNCSFLWTIYNLRKLNVWGFISTKQKFVSWYNSLPYYCSSRLYACVSVTFSKKLKGRYPTCKLNELSTT